MDTTRYEMFKKELRYVVDMLNQNDPNGEWAIEDIASNPMTYIEILERWREEYDYQAVPRWIDNCIDYLMLIEA